MNKFDELRNKYKEFRYKGYTITEDIDKIAIEYLFEIPYLSVFKPIIEIEKRNIKFKPINNDFVKKLVFNIGMIELISYWKCACPKKVIIECGELDNEQISWFKKLYYYGLGEYRYVNHIDVSCDEMLDIEIELNDEYKLSNDTIDKSLLNGILIPVGGGKDSCVTLELLSQDINNNLCLIVGGKEPSVRTAEIAGYNDKIVYVNRVIDKRLIELNKLGYLNGHTPFSSMIAFLSYLIAYLTGKKYVSLSNESSANESNVKGENINHQYSKSFEFEEDFRQYVDKYFNAKVEYFSMLRPLNELQIAMLFSRFKKYHKIFRSCNVGSKVVPWKWCGDCPKCLFVYIILSPFLYKNELIEIFGNDLFEKEGLLKTFIDLCGYGETKPFECVGTYEEVNFAIAKTIEKLSVNNIELPYLLNYYKENYDLVNTDIDITKRYNRENNLPKEYDDILRGWILND